MKQYILILFIAVSTFSFAQNDTGQNFSDLSDNAELNKIANLLATVHKAKMLKQESFDRGMSKEMFEYQFVNGSNMLKKDNLDHEIQFIANKFSLNFAKTGKTLASKDARKFIMALTLDDSLNKLAEVAYYAPPKLRAAKTAEQARQEFRRSGQKKCREILSLCMAAVTANAVKSIALTTVNGTLAVSIILAGPTPFLIPLSVIAVGAASVIVVQAILTIPNNRKKCTLDYDSCEREFALR